MFVKCLACNEATHRYLRWFHLYLHHPVLAVTFTHERADIGVLFAILN